MYLKYLLITNCVCKFCVNILCSVCVYNGPLLEFPYFIVASVKRQAIKLFYFCKFDRCPVVSVRYSCYNWER